MQPAGASRAFGLRVAAPDAGGGSREHYTSGISAAAALAARTGHKIHDALEVAYGEVFLSLPAVRRALCLKALLAHGARWLDETCQLLIETLGPHDRRQHVRQKDNVRRFLGYGFVDEAMVVACAADRATCWAVGEIGPEQAVAIDLPLPTCISGRTAAHELAATLAWFSPPLPGRRSYRTVRLALLEPEESLQALRVLPESTQPDQNQSQRGTVFSRRWTGRRAPAIGAGESMRVVIQRQPDQGIQVDEPVPFALALTLSMEAAIALYDEVRARLGVVVRPSAV